MGSKVGIEVSIAAAELLVYACGCCGSLPHYSANTCGGHLSELVADGHLDAEFVPVESGTFGN